MSRGSYRSSYESLVDDAEYQALSPLAQAVFHTLKLKLGQYGIAVFYTSMLEDIHSRASRDQIRDALCELEAQKANGARGWIKIERNVVWMVNGLRFDPSFTEANTNNRKGAVAFTKGLPRLAIVDEFLSYYDLTSPSVAPTNPLPTPSPTPGVSTDTETETEKETETESGVVRLVLSKGESTIAVENPGTTRDDPPADAGTDNDPQQPVESAIVRRFLHLFYGAASEKRRTDVIRQLNACLTAAGTKLDKATVVRAYDLAHLEACAAQLQPADVRQRDKAIHLLLLKLRDTWAEVKAAREKPPEIPRRRELPAGSPTTIGEILKQRRAHA